MVNNKEKKFSQKLQCGHCLHNAPIYGLAVGKDINGDLTDVYLPAINLLIDIYYRN